MADQILGPVDCLAVEFPGGVVDADPLERIDQMVDAGTIDVLDLEFISKGSDAAVRKVALEDIQVAGDVDITAWGGAPSGLLDESDIAKVGASIAQGSVAGILVYKNVWAVPFLAALDRGRARLVGWERIGSEDLQAAVV
jgi:hypothetical protein